jgi:peptidoglycan hydrolase FlgJ
VAQAALETGWGRYIIRGADGRNSHNLFGIKALRDWNGPTVAVTTLEYESGVPVRRVQPFRVYESLDASFGDYLEFLKTSPRYESALSVAGQPEAFLRGLQAAGYATDPAYAQKILTIMDGDMLRRGLATAPPTGNGDIAEAA